MARRSPWAASIQRTLKALSRAGARAVKATAKASRKASAASLKATRASLKATAAAPKPRAKRTRSPKASAPSAERWISGVAIGPSGARRYKLLKPPGARKSAPLPLLVLLHGCDRDATAIARSTRVARLAARAGFIVMCPEQERLANAQGCWRWFEMRNGGAIKEAASIVAAIDQAGVLHGADVTRVVVAGLSAGASMAALIAARYPERIRAVAMHSGVAPGSASSTATVLRAMQGRGKPAALAPSIALPPLLVIQGTRDGIVAPANGGIAARWWAAASAAHPHATRTLQRGSRYAVDVTDFKSGSRRAVTLCEVHGLAHAWSGGAAGQHYSDPKGPDAMRMIWAFAARALKARA